MTQSGKSISPLRQRMLEDMALRKLSPKTQKTYLRIVKEFTRFLGRSPDNAEIRMSLSETQLAGMKIVCAFLKRRKLTN